MKNLDSSSDSSWPSNVSPITSTKKTSQESGDQPASSRQRTRARIESLRTGKKGPRRRREEYLNRLGITTEQVSIYPEIMPVLKQSGIEPGRLVEVLRCDMEADSMKFVQLWDSQKPANRSIIRLEGLAVACGLTPRRLWELYCGATMMQSRESLGVQIAEALPAIMRVTIKDAKKVKGFISREHIYKAARVLPTPKGTVINLPGSPAQAQLTDGGPTQTTEPDDGGMVLGSADDFMVKASRAMNGPRALAAPPPPAIEPEEDEDGDE